MPIIVESCSGNSGGSTGTDSEDHQHHIEQQQQQQPVEDGSTSLMITAAALAIPQMTSPTLRRRRSISAECGKNLEVIAEENHGGTTGLTATLNAASAASGTEVKRQEDASVLGEDQPR